MKKILFVIFCTLASLAKAQQVPTGLGSQTINQNWSRNGNTGNGSTPTNANIFGTAWNSPIYTISNGLIRMKLNGTYAIGNQYSVNGFTTLNSTINTTGYLGLGLNTGNIWNTKGPFSMLHLNGNGSFVQELGYRPWMQTGITFTSNSDMAYIGHRATNGVEDRTDLMFVWSDNPIGDVQDNLIFAYSTGDQSHITTNDLDGTVSSRPLTNTIRY